MTESRSKHEISRPFEVRDIRQKDFFLVDDVMIDSFARVIGPIAYAVYGVLCRHAGADQQSHPSIATIAEKVDIDPKTVIKGLYILEICHCIEVERPRGRCNIYHLLDKKAWAIPALDVIHPWTTSTGVPDTPMDHVHMSTTSTSGPRPQDPWTTSTGVPDTPMDHVHWKVLKAFKALNTSPPQAPPSGGGVCDQQDIQEDDQTLLKRLDVLLAICPLRMRKSRGRTEKAWLRIRPSEALVARMAAIIETAKTSAEWQREGGRYIPYLSTWLNDKGWLDAEPQQGEIPIKRPRAGPKTVHPASAPIAESIQRVLDRVQAVTDARPG